MVMSFLPGSPAVTPFRDDLRRQALISDPLLTYFGSDLSGVVAYWPMDDASGIVGRVVNPALSEGRNLFIDSDMELAGTANWTVIAGATLSKTTMTQHGGASGQVLQTTSTGTINSGARQTITGLIAGKLYHMTGWEKSDGVGTARVAPSGQVKFTGTTSTSWVQFEFWFLSQGATIDLGNGVATNGGTVYYDDVTCTQVGIKASSSFPTTELLNDAGFDYTSSAWPAATNWTQASSKATHTTGSVSTLNQAISMIIGRTYDVIVVVSGRTAGSVTPRAGSTGTGSSAITSNGTAATQTLTCAGNSVFTLVPTTDFDGAIESVSVVPHDGLVVWDGGLEAWTNATTPTDWAKSVLGTSTVNQETSIVHGGSNACRLDLDGSGSTAQITQACLKAGSTYLVTLWAKCASGSPGLGVANAGGTTYTNGAFTLTTTYTQYSVVIVATDTTLVIKRNTATASASLYIDDIVVTELPAMSGALGNGVTVNQAANTQMIKSFLFDNVNDFDNIWSAALNSAINVDEMTVHVAFKYISGISQGLVRLRVDANNQVQLLINSLSGLTAQINRGGTNNTPSSMTIPSPATVWHTFTVTMSKSGDLIAAYIDGVLMVTSTGLGVWTGNLATTVCIIGANDTSGTNSMNGNLAHALVLNRAATPDEVMIWAQLAGVA